MKDSSLIKGSLSISNKTLNARFQVSVCQTVYKGIINWESEGNFKIQLLIWGMRKLKTREYAKATQMVTGRVKIHAQVEGSLYCINHSDVGPTFKAPEKLGQLQHWQFHSYAWGLWHCLCWDLVRPCLAFTNCNKKGINSCQKYKYKHGCPIQFYFVQGISTGISGDFTLATVDP